MNLSVLFKMAFSQSCVLPPGRNYFGINSEDPRDNTSPGILKRNMIHVLQKSEDIFMGYS